MKKKMIVSYNHDNFIVNKQEKTSCNLLRKPTVI